MNIKTISKTYTVKDALVTLKRSVIKRVWIEAPNWDDFLALNADKETRGDFTIIPVRGLPTPTMGYALGVLTINTAKYRIRALEHIRSIVGAVPGYMGVTESKDVDSPGYIQKRRSRDDLLLDDFVAIANRHGMHRR